MRGPFPQAWTLPRFAPAESGIPGVIGVAFSSGELWGGLLFVVSFVILTWLWEPAREDFWRLDILYPRWGDYTSLLRGILGTLPLLILTGIFTILLIYGASLTVWWGVLGLGGPLIVWTLLRERSNPFHIGYATGVALFTLVSVGLMAFGVPAERFLTGSRGRLVAVGCLIPAFVMWGLAAATPAGRFPRRARQTSATQPVTSGPDAPQGETADNGSEDVPQRDHSTPPQHGADRASERRADTLSVQDWEFGWESPPDVGFDDIGGYDAVKTELEEDVIAPLETDHPGYERFDVDPDRGILFYGPPGTGKTLFARALASSLNRPFVELNQADLTSKFINESPSLISDLFDEAQQLEGVVFIDEAEALLGGRGSSLSTHQEDQKVTTTFLSELARDERRFVLILATNRREDLDDAVTRPGRIDKQVELPLPDADARYEILRTKLCRVPTDIDEQTLKLYALEVEGQSGADIEQAIEDARRNAAERNAEALTLQDFEGEAAARVRGRSAEERAADDRLEGLDE